MPAKAKTKSSPEPIDLYDRQRDVVDLVKQNKFSLAYGSSRGGKSFIFAYLLIVRALAYPGSSHCVIRLTANSIESTIWPTFLRVIEALDPNYRQEIDLNKINRRITLHNGSTVWFFGANDEDQILKIMGSQFATIMIDEIVDLDNKTYNRILTRLNADPDIVNARGERIRLKIFATCNPKAKSHWVYQIWGEKRIPGKKEPLVNPKDFGWIQFDRYANPDVDQDYYLNLQNASDEEKASYLEGEWYDEVQGAYFSKADIDAHRERTPDISKFDITGIGLDPAMTATPTSDETGIMVWGMKLLPDETGQEQRHYYPLADLSGRYHPHEWAEIAARAYTRWGCAFVVVETNQGGNSNVVLLEDADAKMNILTVHAGVGQGKNARAQPIAKVMKAGRVHMPFEGFEELEDQMIKMTGDYDRKRQTSPDRLDAAVYAIGELMTGDHFAKPVVVSKIANFMR